MSEVGRLLKKLDAVKLVRAKFAESSVDEEIVGELMGELDDLGRALLGSKDYALLKEKVPEYNDILRGVAEKYLLNQAVRGLGEELELLKSQYAEDWRNHVGELNVILKRVQARLKRIEVANSMSKPFLEIVDGLEQLIREKEWG